MTNCPNCGAVITGPKCEYCDTRFDIDISGYTSKAKLEAENNLVTFKIKALSDSIKIKGLYEEALKAMRNYGYGGY